VPPYCGVVFRNALGFKPMRHGGVRWGAVWGVLCLVGAIVTTVSGRACSSHIQHGAVCTGFQHFAYTNEWLLAAFIVTGFAGALILGRLQSRTAGRACNRCGERVANGVLDCPHCGFDFRSIGT